MWSGPWSSLSSTDYSLSRPSSADQVKWSNFYQPKYFQSKAESFSSLELRQCNMIKTRKEMHLILKSASKERSPPCRVWRGCCCGNRVQRSFGVTSSAGVQVRSDFTHRHTEIKHATGTTETEYSPQASCRVQSLPLILPHSSNQLLGLMQKGLCHIFCDNNME